MAMVAWALLAIGAACEAAAPDKSAPDQPSVVETPSAAVDVTVFYVSGCEALLDEGPCLTEESQALNLWLEQLPASAAVEVRIAGQPVEHEHGSDRRLVSVAREDRHGTLELFVDRELALELELESLPTEFIDARNRVIDIANAKDRPADQRWEAARAQLERELELQPRGLVRQQLDCVEGHLAYMLRDWATVLERPWQLEAGEGPVDLICAADLHVQAASVLTTSQPDFELAAQHLQAAKAHSFNMDATISAEYQRWVLAQRLGRLDASIDGLDEVATLARSVGDLETAAGADIMVGVALAGLGRFEEARVRAREALANPELDENLARQIRENAAWIQLSWREEQPEVEDPSDQLRALIAQFEADADKGRAERTRLNLAIAASQNHDYGQVREQLARIEVEVLDLSERVYVELLHAEADIREHSFASANEHIARAELYGSLGFEAEPQLRAAVGRAEFELAAGHRQRAREAFAAVERLADRVSLGISPAAGRSLFSVKLREVGAKHVELLRELGDERAALCTILGARARHLRTLMTSRSGLGEDPAELARFSAIERRRVELEAQRSASADLSERNKQARRAALAEEAARLDDEVIALLERNPPPWQCERVFRTDAALLTMHPASEGGWWFVLARGPELYWAHSEGEEPEHTLALALAQLPLADVLDGAAELQVVAVGEMIAVDVHAQPAVQAAEVPVVYSFALGPARTQLDPRAGAVVLFDDQLRRARHEVVEVSRLLRGSGWRVGGDWRRDAEVQPALLHIASHGYHVGPAGWDSYVALPKGGQLRPTDLLAIRRAPGVVVLGACDTGTAEVRAIDGGMNMAAAFLLAGAELVVAPDEPILDELGERFAASLYRSGPREADRVRGLVGALSRTQRDSAEFASWRALVP